MNGEILTPDGGRQALAIKGDMIAFVGSDVDAQGLTGPGTEVIDLQGAAVLPGLHDLHVHAIGGGIEQSSCKFRSGATPDEILAAVEACVEAGSPGEWISGGNWVAAVFSPGQQNKEFLDQVSPDNPVILSDESHHSLWANSAALDAAGIDRDTPDPINGEIDHDENGEPTGLLREAAGQLVYKVVPPHSEAKLREGLQIASDLMLSYGVTSFTDAGLDLASLKVHSDMSREGAMKQRVRGCLWWRPFPEELRAEMEQRIAQAEDFDTERFKADCVKVGLDGVPTESHTAAMLEPYAGSEDTGMTSVPSEILFPAVIEFDKQGRHVKFHAAGDAAVRQAIDAIEAAREANGSGGPFHDVSHNSFVDPADIPRIPALNSSWEFSPYIWYPSPITEDIRAAVGEERMKRWIPIGDAVAAGGLVGPGSDWSVVPSINPWLAIETMVTRQRPGGSEETLGESQAVSLSTAIDIFTKNGAVIMGQGDSLGSLEKGKIADFVVVSQNPFAIPVTDIHKTKAVMTFINGEKVYDASRNDSGEGE